MNINNTVFPTDIVYHRNISINTLHKRDDNNNNKQLPSKSKRKINGL